MVHGEACERRVERAVGERQRLGGRASTAGAAVSARWRSIVRDGSTRDDEAIVGLVAARFPRRRSRTRLGVAERGVDLRRECAGRRGASRVYVRPIVS